MNRKPRTVMERIGRLTGTAHRSVSGRRGGYGGAPLPVEDYAFAPDESTVTVSPDAYAGALATYAVTLDLEAQAAAAGVPFNPAEVTPCQFTRALIALEAL